MTNADWLRREQASLGTAMQRTGDPMYGPVIVRGQGSRLWDVEGQLFFDLTCGYSAANFGHAFPPLLEISQQQLGTLTHLTGQSHPGRAALAELLIEHCGRPGDRVIFNTSGAKAIETAIKIAWSHRPGKIVSLAPAYHGRSLVTSLLSETARVASFEQAHCVQRPLEEFAYCQACPAGLTYPDCQLECQRSLVQWIDQHHASISSILVEPAVGARGYIAPPAQYWLKLRQVTAKYGILMIADEIQMGLGRAGCWLLSRHQGWQADLVVLGKSLGGGIAPISAVLGDARLINSLPPGSESETFAASPLATALGCEVIRQLATGPWLERAPHLGARLAAAVVPLSGEQIQVETLGASVSIEFIGSSPSRTQAAARARRLAEQFFKAGCLVHYSGPFGTRVVLLPPLTMSEEELGQCADRLSTGASSTGAS